MKTPEFKAKIIAWLERKRSWQATGQLQAPRLAVLAGSAIGASRSRSCTNLDDDGEPTGLTRAVPTTELPVRLPDLEDFKPTGSPEGPLVKATTGSTSRSTARRYRRETNTMPQWAGSCWYYLRYLDPQNDQAFCDREKAKLLAAGRSLRRRRRACRAAPALLAVLAQGALRPRLRASSPEPFQRLVNQGMILGEMEFTGYKRRRSMGVGRSQGRSR